MSSDFLITSVPYLVIVAVSVTGFVYAAYLALTVWRGLSVPIYRSRALWTGVLTVSLAIITPVSGNVGNLFPSNFYVLGIILIYIGLYPLSLTFLFIWMDRTITTLVRLDYLRRDLVRWSTMRYFYWAFAVIDIIVYYDGVVYPQFESTIIWGLSFLTFFGVPAAYGSLALLVGSRRTTDHTFRLHAKWLGYTILAIILAALVATFTANIAIDSAPYLLISYCFYKVARFLVPVGKIQTDQGT